MVSASKKTYKKFNVYINGCLREELFEGQSMGIGAISMMLPYKFTMAIDFKCLPLNSATGVLRHFIEVKTFEISLAIDFQREKSCAITGSEGRWG